MNFIIAATTDIGLTKGTNQDSYNVRVFSTRQGKIVLAVLCDGMGGLAKGEVASATIVNAFYNWGNTRLSALCETGITDDVIRAEWIGIATEYNDKIKTYATSCGINMGTTATVLMLTQNRYYIMNVGDTRAYEITDTVTILTKDQSVVGREVELGNLTPEQAEHDPRRSVLLQCIGASTKVLPDMFFGDTKLGAVYMLCTDGFRHEITVDEIYQYLNPNMMVDADGMKANMDALIDLNKYRQERDNISVVTIRTF